MLLTCAIAEAKRQDKPVDPSSDDHVYTQREVDQKAVVDRKSRLANLPSGHDCRAQQGTVALRVVLRKSGVVTDVVVTEKSGCESFDEKAVRAVQKLKFTPAKKDGSDVSQYLLLEFHYSAW
jgi:TonB family protein